MRAVIASLVYLCGMSNAYVLPRAIPRQPLSSRAAEFRRQQVALNANGDKEVTNNDLDEVFEVIFVKLSILFSVS